MQCNNKTNINGTSKLKENLTSRFFVSAINKERETHVN